MLSTVHQQKFPKNLAFNVWRVNKTHNYVINGMEENVYFNIIIFIFGIISKHVCVC